MDAVSPVRFIAVGASAGGFDAVSRILAGLTAEMKLPIGVVLHLPEEFPYELGRSFTRMHGRRVVEVEDKQPIREREVYFAPPGYHLLVEQGCKNLALSRDDKVHFARPSIDVFFKSVAEACGSSALGVLLTGANEDGAQGMKAIADRGGLTVVQNPRTAQVPMMPESALALFRPTLVADIETLPEEIDRLVAGRGMTT